MPPLSDPDVCHSMLLCIHSKACFLTSIDQVLQLLIFSLFVPLVVEEEVIVIVAVVMVVIDLVVIVADAVVVIMSPFLLVLLLILLVSSGPFCLISVFGLVVVVV